MIRRLVIPVAVVAAAGIAVAGATGGVATAVPQTTTAATWKVEQNPSAPLYGVLFGVSCPTSSFCAAVGFYISSEQSGVKGEAWVRKSDNAWHTTTVTANGGAQLTSVSCVSATFCIAVGSTTAGDQVAFRWNGSSWAPTPAVTAEAGANVKAVSCVSTTWCLAAGYFGNHQGPEKARVWRYNGTKWDAGTPPTIAGTASVQLRGVACRSTSFCLVAGEWVYGVNAHPWAGSFNGASWTTSGPSVPAPYTSAELNAISCPSTTECTAVGEADTSGESAVQRPYAARLTNGAWQVENVPGFTDNADSRLTSVSCAANGSCTATGGSQNQASYKPALAVTKTGSTWARDTTPDPGIAVLASALTVSCPSTTTCISVGITVKSENPSHEYIMKKG